MHSLSCRTVAQRSTFEATDSCTSVASRYGERAIDEGTTDNAVQRYGPDRYSTAKPKGTRRGHRELLRRHGSRRPFEARLRDCVGEAVELSNACHSTESN